MTRKRAFVALSLATALVATLIPVAGVSAASPFLTFTVQPGDAIAGDDIPGPPTVHVTDGSGGSDLSGIVVTLAIRPSSNTVGGTLTCSGGLTRTSNASGLAVFNGCSINKVQIDYELRASAPAASAVNSGLFDVNVGPAHHLAFSAYPSPSTSALLSPQPEVQVVDAAGNLVIGDTRVITLAINLNVSTFACTGGLTKAAAGGVATFAGCTQGTAATGYVLTASASGVLPAVGASFNVTSGTPTKLLLCWGSALPCNTTPPTTITGGTAFSVQPVVRVADAAGNTVITDGTTVVSLAILAGTPLSGGPGTLSCTGGLTRTVVAGVGTFGGCAVDRPGTGYRLAATSVPSYTAAQSNAFNVVVGPPTKLVFIVQPPASATAGAPFPGSIQVAIADAGGNTVTMGITATIGLTIGVNPGGGSLVCSGGNNATTVSGVATLVGCTITNQGNGYTLIASALATAPVTTLATATSITITVLAPASAITLTPSSTVITWGGEVVLSVHFSVNRANKPFTIQVSKDGLAWSNIAGAALTTNAAGDASFAYGPSDNRYYRVSFLGTPDLQAGTSAVVRVVVRQINILRPAPGLAIHGITRGTAITFESTIRPNRPELPQAVARFVVYQLTSSGWTRVLDRMVPVNRADGKALLMITFNTAGQFYVRSQAIPTTFNANSVWSGLVRYAVL